MESDMLLLCHESFPEESYSGNQLRFKLIMNLSILVYLLVPQFKGKNQVQNSESLIMQYIHTKMSIVTMEFSMLSQNKEQQDNSY